MAESRGISVIIPCFNEAQGITPVLEQLLSVLSQISTRRSLDYEVIVVDDGSVDGSAERIAAGKFNASLLRVISHERNRGYGAALKTGARAALYDYIAITDADGTYPSEKLHDLILEMESAPIDMAVGARTQDNTRFPLPRRIGKAILGALANYLTQRQIPDLNSGLRVARRELWMRFERYYPDGFSLTTTITLAALTNGYRVSYLPIDYRPRVGHSKIRPLREMLNFIQLIVRTTIYFDPMRVFVPLSALLFSLGLVIGFGSLIMQNIYHEGRFLDTTTFLLVVAALNLLAIGALADLITKRLP